MGNGEFTLKFGDYDVKITVPAHHIVAAGGLQHESKVLTSTQQKRLKQDKKPVLIITPAEALANESHGSLRQNIAL